MLDLAMKEMKERNILTVHIPEQTKQSKCTNKKHDDSSRAAPCSDEYGDDDAHDHVLPFDEIASNFKGITPCKHHEQEEQKAQHPGKEVITNSNPTS